MNPPRVQFIREKVLEAARDDGEESERVLEGLSVLDVGCGGGLLAEVCQTIRSLFCSINSTQRNLLNYSHSPD